MKTPIADFCRQYADGQTIRFHMPGHKGQGPLGVEALDLTEVRGADSLYEAMGIIAESEAGAASLFGTRATFYSCGGSSESIKAMCLLAVRQYAKTHSGRAVLLAGRNAHKSFVGASQLIGFDIRWLSSEEEDYALCRCTITPTGLEQALSAMKQGEGLPAAVFVTSPDYLGNVLDIAGLAKVAHSYAVPLLVDNAHGAYLKFLPEDRHPITLGADACADSAHKTLPVLTGGAYLHIGANAPEGFEETAREAMGLFGSTSPSYLVLQSLDLCNDWLEKTAHSAFAETLERVEAVRDQMKEKSLALSGEESLKITLDAPGSGLGTGTELAEWFRSAGIECEYADRDFVVFMFSPFNRGEDFDALARAVRALEPGERTETARRSTALPEAVLQPYEVLSVPAEEVPVENALGRVAALVRIGCPPAVLPVVPGERVDKNVIEILRSCGIGTLNVIK
ncbi:MAG: amino acid decarboxylase [Clostridia bacterium]|nr:amino acid decarboxylase [Clostridia bacterium]